MTPLGDKIIIHFDGKEKRLADIVGNELMSFEKVIKAASKEGAKEAIQPLSKQVQEHTEDLKSINFWLLMVKIGKFRISLTIIMFLTLFFLLTKT